MSIIHRRVMRSDGMRDDQTGYELSLYEKDGLQLQWREPVIPLLRTAKGVGMSRRTRRANIASSTLIQQPNGSLGDAILPPM